MTQRGICVRPKRRLKSTTDSNHPFAIAENLLERNFRGSFSKTEKSNAKGENGVVEGEGRVNLVKSS